MAGQRAGLRTRHASTPAPAAGIPGVPATPQSPPGFTPDSSYLADAALRQFQRQQQLGQLDQQSGFDRTTHQEAIRRIREGLDPARQQTSETANKQGLFYSGQLGKRLGDVQKDFTRREGDENTAFTQRQAARDAARRAIEAGAPLEEASALAGAADRQVQRDTAAADANALVPNPAPAAPAAVGGHAQATTRRRPARRRARTRR